MGIGYRYLCFPSVDHSDFSNSTMYRRIIIITINNNICFRSLVNPPERRDDDNITT